MIRHDLPPGTVTFLFSDVEGSTRLLHELGDVVYEKALAEHRRLLRQAFAARGGVEVDTQGDAFFYAFPSAPAAAEAAATATEALASGRIRVRIGLHTGTPLLTGEGYVGEDVHRAARIAAVGHGGQLLLSAATAALLGAAHGLRDLGEHRLKDLSAPERIYQLGAGEFPPLKTLYRTNLPVPATPFLGRERELGEVGALLAREDVRLLTLSGPGGTGKTRLALQAAAGAAERFPDGVFWVPLAPLRDPELVPAEAARALGAKDGLAEHVADKRLLLVLDNFEHLVDAAAPLAGLLSACPNLRLLVTSRELLGLAGEQAYPVPPLAPVEGIDFFCARAHAAEPAFAPDETVGELCRRLDDLPLALELAAARVRVLTPAQLLERLSGRLDLLKAGRGADPRQQTLRATIEWSHDLLDDDERRLFARLAVFRGGCSLEAVEAVCGADLDLLQALVDKSLLRHSGERFWMLETIREYALEQLDASGDVDALHGRHADHYLALAEEAEPEVLRGAPETWLDRLAVEHDNLRAALDRLAAAGDTQQALRLGSALAPFWLVHGHYLEGRQRLDAALAADDRPTAARASALIGWSRLVMTEPRLLDAFRRRVEEALAIYERLQDAWGIAFAQMTAGDLALAREEGERALAIFESSREAFRAVGDEHHVLALTRKLAHTHGLLGHDEASRAYAEEFLARARELGNERLIAPGLRYAASWSIEEGRLVDALAALAESYRIDCKHGFSVYVAVDLVRLADVLVRQGKAADAARLVARSDTVHEEIGVARESWAQEMRDETTELVRARLADDAFDDAYRHGRTLSVDEAAGLALGELDGETRRA